MTEAFSSYFSEFIVKSHPKSYQILTEDNEKYWYREGVCAGCGRVQDGFAQIFRLVAFVITEKSSHFITLV